MSTLITHTKEAGLIKVVDFWNLTQNGDIWRTWKNTHKALNIPNEINIQPLLAHLDTRKILNQQGNDILRWGHTSIGTLNIQEAYRLKAGHGSLPTEEVWRKIWETNSWPKINTFLWQTAHNNILTWDNLRKRGFIGPSWC